MRSAEAPTTTRNLTVHEGERKRKRRELEREAKRAIKRTRDYQGQMGAAKAQVKRAMKLMGMERQRA